MPVSVLCPEVVRLVGDDWVVVKRAGDELWMEAPDVLRGKIEVRGVGIVDLARDLVAAERVRLVMAVDLVSNRDEVERMPDETLTDVAGCAVAGFKLYPFEASAALKVRLAAAAVPI